jgi:molybdopterin synthase catalytic subunit
MSSMQRPPDWVELSEDPLDAARSVEFVTDPSAGGIAVFLGTTRAETSPSGASLVALDYQAYPEMAVRQMRDLCARARSEWPVLRIALLHRTGRVAVGEPSVVIATSTPHRGDAFASCRFLIDALKAEVAVWKQEVWADGTTAWVHPDAVAGAPRT